MPQEAWSEGTAQEIAARTVNKERARAGVRSHSGPAGRTRDQLYEEAKALGIPGRSSMDKRELQAAVDRRRGRRG